MHRSCATRSTTETSSSFQATGTTAWPGRGKTIDGQETASRGHFFKKCQKCPLRIRRAPAGVCSKQRRATGARTVWKLAGACDTRPSEATQPPAPLTLAFHIVVGLWQAGRQPRVSRITKRMAGGGEATAHGTRTCALSALHHGPKGNNHISSDRSLQHTPPPSWHTFPKPC